MSDKSLKTTGDLKYLNIVVPIMMEYIKRGDGMSIGYARNHHTVALTLNNGGDFNLPCVRNKRVNLYSMG